FESSLSFKLAGSPNSLLTGDLDGDLSPDLATANSGSLIQVLWNGGSRQFFQTTISITGGQGINALVEGDFDRDGNLDFGVALGREPSPSMSIWKNQGARSFEPALEFPLPSLPALLVSFDWNGDGGPDLAFFSRKICPNNCASEN